MGNFDHYAYGNNVRGAGGFTFIWWLARGGREGGKEAWGGLGTVTLAKRKARQLGTSGGDWGFWSREASR